MNKILRENNPILKKFYYFIGGLLKALDIAGNNSNLGLKNISQIYYAQIITLNELICFKENINKIIAFKYFISTCPCKELPLKFLGDQGTNYRVLFIINYRYKGNLKFDCFNISELSYFPAEKEILFPLFNFFQVDSV